MKNSTVEYFNKTDFRNWPGCEEKDPKIVRGVPMTGSQTADIVIDGNDIILEIKLKQIRQKLYFIKSDVKNPEEYVQKNFIDKSSIQAKSLSKKLGFEKMETQNMLPFES